jgi:predicted PhzF superfamily epimerase YddE/YHI9
MLAMDFPAAPARPVDAPEGLAEALGAVPEWTGRNGQNDLLALLDHPDAVRSLAPDLERLRRIDARGVCVTAAESGEGDVFVSRFFAPNAGVAEDPVTGSAHCMLTPFWAERLGRAELIGRQLSARGGTVRVSARGDRVTLTGSAVTMLDGTLHAVG